MTSRTKIILWCTPLVGIIYLFWATYPTIKEGKWLTEDDYLSITARAIGLLIQLLSVILLVIWSSNL